jgi:hypothetical protein
MIRFFFLFFSFSMFPVYGFMEHLISASPGIIHGTILIAHHLPFFQKLIASQKPQQKNEKRIRALLHCLHYPGAQQLEIRALPAHHLEFKVPAFVVGNILIINETLIDSYSDDELYSILHEATLSIKTAYFLKLIAASFLIPLLTISTSHVIKSIIFPFLPLSTQNFYRFINTCATGVLTYSALKMYITYENEKLQQKLSFLNIL